MWEVGVLQSEKVWGVGKQQLFFFSALSIVGIVYTLKAYFTDMTPILKGIEAQGGEVVSSRRQSPCPPHPTAPLHSA